MGERKTILVVDDDESILGFVQLVLEDEGYATMIARTGAAALAAVQQQPPALILLDLRMPEMDGWGFSRAYRELPGPHAPIVVLTARREGPARASELAAAAFLSKPFDLDELMELVKRYVP